MTITSDEAKKLLDGTTPGPWAADGDPWNRIIWSSAENRVCFMAHSNGLNDDQDMATSRLVAAAPDLARTVIALHAQLADAQAAMAMVGERCADMIEDNVRHAKELGREIWAMPDLRALAPIDGLALVQELRAERDAASSVAAAAYGATLDWEQILEDDALWQAQDDIAKSRVACMTAEAERDRLAAANAVLEAKVAGLRDLLERGAMHVSLSLRAWHGEVRAALATQEAGNA